jgi:signal peptidase
MQVGLGAASRPRADARWLGPQPAVAGAPHPDPESWPRALFVGIAVGLLAMVAGLVFWSVVPRAVGWRSQVVLTGSMQPRIAPGDLVLAAPAARGELKPGRVVLFRDPVHPTRTIVHRLMRYDDDGNLITKGDANGTEDSTPVPPASVLGLPRLRVPFIGRPVVWLHERNTPALLGASTVLGLLAISLWGPSVSGSRR